MAKACSLYTLSVKNMSAPRGYPFPRLAINIKSIGIVIACALMTCLMGVSGCQFVKPDEAKLVLMKEGKGLVPIIVFKDAHSEYPRAILAAARILVSQQKNDEALALLAKYDTSRSKTYGRRVLEASGDIYFIMGKKDKALAKYE